MATAPAASSTLSSSAHTSSTPIATPNSSTPAASSMPASAVVGPTFQCEQCRSLSQFVGIPRVVRMIGVSRSTIYYWMDRGWIHWRLLPSGRRVICMSSLSSSGEELVPKHKAF